MEIHQAKPEGETEKEKVQNILMEIDPCFISRFISGMKCNGQLVLFVK